MMRAILLAAVLSVASCAELGRRAVVDVAEYDLYRRYRLAPSVEAKLAAGYQYLNDVPNGAWRTEVRGWFTLAEMEYVEAAWDDVDRLERFVAAVPSGPFAKAAADRVVQLRIASDHLDAHEKVLDEKAAAIARRLEQARRGRRNLLEGVAWWVAKIAAIRPWGVRTSELDHELIHRYRLVEPAARCIASRCSKTIVVDYAVPEDKQSSSRQAIFDVVLELQEGGVVAATLTGPELFSRIGEAVDLRPVPPRDYGARAEAIGRAAHIVEVAVETVLPAHECRRDAVSPVVVRRECRGVELLVVSAADPTKEDRITVRPSGDRPDGGVGSP